MRKLLRKLFGRDTGKVRSEAVRENLRRECSANHDAASQLIHAVRKTRRVCMPPVKIRKGWHGPESV